MLAHFNCRVILGCPLLTQGLISLRGEGGGYPVKMELLKKKKNPFSFQNRNIFPNVCQVPNFSEYIQCTIKECKIVFMLCTNEKLSLIEVIQSYIQFESN